MPDTNLPFGSEFSPAQINLATLLELAEQNEGDVAGLDAAIKQTYFDPREISEDNRRKLAMNCRLSMIGYGLVTRDVELTELGRHLLSIRAEPDAFHFVLARHILLNLNGLPLVQTIQDMQSHNTPISLVSLRGWLDERGIYFPRGGKHVSTMRQWLEQAGVFLSKGWRIDEARLEEVVGASSSSLDTLAMFTPEQKAYLKTLANMGGEGPYRSNEVEQLATTTYGVPFNEKGLPRQVLYPLRDAGYITLSRAEGRGSHPFEVCLTDKIQQELVAPLVEALEAQTVADLRPMLRKSLAELLEEIKSDDKHIKGLALEALAFHLMRLVDLRYVGTRLRGATTGGAEVDLLFEGARLLFSRWQVQCKNTKTVSLDDVAKEVGLTFQLKSNVVMVVSTGAFSRDARSYAQSVMQSTNLHLVLLDSTDLQQIAVNPPYIASALYREARRAMQIKRLEL